MEEELRALLRHPQGPHLFIRGPEASGKTRAVKQVLEDISQAIYLDRHDYGADDMWSTRLGVESLPDLLSSEGHRLVCLDDAEWWLSDISRQQQLLLLGKCSQIRLLLVSRWPRHRFPLPSLLELHPPTLNFSNLLKSNLKAEPKIPPTILPLFVEHVVALGKGLPLKGLVSLLRQLWPIYAEPALNGHLPWDHAQLSLRANPRIRSLLEGEQTTALQFKVGMVSGLSKTERWLLLAAYIASQTNGKHDLLIFGQHLAGKKTKVKPAPPKKESASSVAPPRIFGLDRLIAIYQRLAPADRQPPLIIIRRTIQRLIDLNLIMRISHEANVEQPKLRCNLTPDLAHLLARTQQLSLDLYL